MKLPDVEPRELVVAAATGAVFGLFGYWLTRYIHAGLSKAGIG